MEDRIYHQKGVYFLKHQEYLKIGLSNNIPKRIKDLRHSFPGVILSLEVLGTTDNYTERELHLRFKRFRVAGDWFRYEDPLQRFIRTL